MTHSPQAVRRMLAENDLRPRRAFGQNFVADPNTVRRIARLAEVGPGDRVVEVGAGLGSLTLALVETGAAVKAVEIDRGLAAVLRTIVEPLGVEVVEGDAMSLDWAAVLGEQSWTLVANLPYNVATPLVADLLDTVPSITRMLVMVQQEVAERLAAEPGDGAYGAVSVKVACWARARVVGRVPRSVFFPVPKVESALVRIDRRPVAAVADPVVRARMFELVAAGFGQRRKMLRRSLAALAGVAELEAAGIRPEARAEELGVDDWARLAATAPGQG